MVTTSRTLGPLHFEDLEPKRFEDLIRQLVYDFKPWRRLEATGRAGSDDGFDARGFEIINAETVTAGDADADAEAVPVEGADDRLWLVQCKREKEIGPRKLVKYLQDTRLAETELLYGIVFAAACDFSKLARDNFRKECEAHGIKEWHLWGKAELEDKLLRPENDALLFAYFGVSLTIRRRSQRTELRSKLAMKRKLNRHLESISHSYVLLRAPDAELYPHRPTDMPTNDIRAPWLYRKFIGFSYDGLKFQTKRYFAYLADDGKSWDAAMRFNDALAYDDPWGDERAHLELRYECLQAWEALPEANRAWLEAVGHISFDRVLDVDELGDEYVQTPHLYVPFQSDAGPFNRFWATVTSAKGQRSHDIVNGLEGRVERFPGNIREAP